jgi:hypothetical protein
MGGGENVYRVFRYGRSREFSVGTAYGVRVIGR